MTVVFTCYTATAIAALIAIPLRGPLYLLARHIYTLHSISNDIPIFIYYTVIYRYSIRHYYLIVILYTLVYHKYEVAHAEQIDIAIGTQAI